jgi:hypothetical protein
VVTKIKEDLVMVARLVECTDHDMQYGILTVENVSAKKVQEKIYEIKHKFSDVGFNDWTLDDMFMEFPEEWEWDYMQTIGANVIEV